MKNLVYLIAGVTAAAAYFVAKKQQLSAPRPVDVLAHQLQDAWADHHTVL